MVNGVEWNSEYIFNRKGKFLLASVSFNLIEFRIKY